MSRTVRARVPGRLHTRPAPGATFPTNSTRLIAFNKPYGVLCQFTSSDGRASLGDYVDVPGVYPAGRLDADSEGLMLLTNDGKLQHRISDPRHKLLKRYLVQVERVPAASALLALRAGVEIDGKRTREAEVEAAAEPDWLWPREPPVRFRRNIPTAWLRLGLREGRNRQVRRMTAAVGHPTLRLLRTAIGPIQVAGLAPGEWRDVSSALLGPR